MSQVVIVASGVTSVAVDGVKYVPEAPPIDPPVDPPVPPVIPPGGNPGAILPPLPWPQGQASSDIAHVNNVPNGTIFCYEVPALHAGTAVQFTQGPGTSTQGDCVSEFSVSQTPGVIIDGAAGGPYYQKFTNASANVGMVLNRSTGTMPFVPPGQTWYLNIRWTNKTGMPNAFSLQWIAADN